MTDTPSPVAVAESVVATLRAAEGWLPYREPDHPDYEGDRDEAGKMVRAVLAPAAALVECVRALEDPPILSKYHGMRGFEVERFIADYDAWIARRHAVLAILTTPASQE